MQERIRCGVEATVGVISGKWKPLILHSLFYEGTQRFNALLRKTGAPRQALTVQLRELERDGVLARQVFAEVPPRVEYSLTKLGRALGPVLQGMLEWGERFQAQQRTAPDGATPEDGAAGAEEG
jgi:DNA-binding HxlR family transcriptional regulator